MAHWFGKCPRELHADECRIFTVNKQKPSAVIKTELDNLTNEEIQLEAAQSGIFYSSFTEENLEANLTANQL
eukprot:4398549-Prorocentrum_lima.AAC.1